MIIKQLYVYIISCLALKHANAYLSREVFQEEQTCHSTAEAGGVVYVVVVMVKQ